MSYRHIRDYDEPFLSKFTLILTGIFAFAIYVTTTSYGMPTTENKYLVEINNAFAQQQQPYQITSENANNNNNFSNTFTNTTTNSTLPITKDFNKTSEDNNDGGVSLTKLYDKVDGSVVQVIYNSNIPGQSRLGSGFVYDTKGHIVTNYHVVAENINKEFDITFTDGSTYKAKVIGIDPFSEIAVLMISNQSNPFTFHYKNEKFEPLKIGNFSDVKVGQRVAAVGNPFGLSASITEGIISGLGRLLPTFISTQMNPQSIFEQTSPAFSIPNTIQTDAAINPGNSGGPLLNMQGEVIGINTAIFSDTGAYAGVGFAIPSYLIQKVVPSLIATGKYEHPYVGVSGMDINPDIAQSIGIRNATGFLVINVSEGSPAEKAGIRGGSIVTEIKGDKIELGGDIITKVDNNPVHKIDDLLSYLERQSKVGENITLSIIRNGENQKINLTLTARPNSSALQGEFTQGSQNTNNSDNFARPALGITGIKVTPDISSQMNVPAQITEGGKNGILVISVLKNSSAEKAGIRGGYITPNINDNQVELGGDIILAIDNTTIKSVQDIQNILSTKHIGDKIQVAIFRDNNKLNMPVTLMKAPIQNFTQDNGTPNMPSSPTNPNEPFGLNPFDNFNKNFYNQCIQILDKESCDRLLGR